VEAGKGNLERERGSGKWEVFGCGEDGMNA